MIEYQVAENDNVIIGERFLNKQYKKYDGFIEGMRILDSRIRKVLNDEAEIESLVVVSLCPCYDLDEQKVDSNKLNTLYHGTNLQRAKRIITDGFIKVANIEEAKDNFNKIYLTDNFTYASLYGNMGDSENRYSIGQKFIDKYGKSLHDMGESDGIVTNFLAKQYVKSMVYTYHNKARVIPTKYVVFEFDVKEQELYKLIFKYRDPNIYQAVITKGEITPYFEYYTTKNISTSKIVNVFLVDTSLPESKRVNKIKESELFEIQQLQIDEEKYKNKKYHEQKVVLLDNTYSDTQMFYGTTINNAKKIMSSGKLWGNNEEHFLSDSIDYASVFGKNLDINNSSIDERKRTKDNSYIFGTYKTVSRKFIVFGVNVKNYEIYALLPDCFDKKEIEKIKNLQSTSRMIEYYSKNNIETDCIISIYLIDTALPEGQQKKIITVDELLKL